MKDQALGGCQIVKRKDDVINGDSNATAFGDILKDRMLVSGNTSGGNAMEIETSGHFAFLKGNC